MTLQEKMDLLGLATKYTIAMNDDRSIDISTTDSESGNPLVANVMADGTVQYYVGGCYNNCTEYIPLDIYALQELQTFVHLIMC